MVILVIYEQQNVNKSHSIEQSKFILFNEKTMKVRKPSTVHVLDVLITYTSRSIRFVY